jgi:hypothetical protein
MTFQKVDMLAELKRLAGHKKTRVPEAVILDWAVLWAEAGLAGDPIERLERLYRLPDTRGTRSA